MADKVAFAGENACLRGWHVSCLRWLNYETKVYMKTTLQAEQPMNTTILNFPDFQSMPRGIKQMLLVSEAHFFDQATSHYHEQKAAAQETKTSRGFKAVLASLLHNGGHRVLAPV
jgi:hypothetical protein